MIRHVLVVLLLLACAPAAYGHTRSQSISHWTIEGDALVGRVEADALDATRLYAPGGDAPLDETFRKEVEKSFAVRTDAGPCSAAGPAKLTPAAAGRLAALVVFSCPPGGLARGAVEVRSALFLGVAATHLHFATVTRADGAEAESVLTDTHRAARFEVRADARPETAGSAFLRYVPLGAVHVWSGLDHLAFILGLTLLARGLVPVIVAASGFTLGHTATLALAALGVLNPHAPTVEALIGFTVAFVALEAAGGGPERLTRWSTAIACTLLVLALMAAAHIGVGIAAAALAGLAVFVFAYPRGFPRGASAAPWLAAAFGLVHGCGFAGALGQLDLPRPRLLAALAGFNVGVELAQATVIAAALAVAVAWRRVATDRFAWAPDAVCAILFAVGTYWFASRSL